MTRRSTRAAEDAAAQAAAQASDAARVLQARQHEPKAESTENIQPKSEGQTSPDRIEKLLANRPHNRAMDDLMERRGLNEEPKEELKDEPKPEAKTEEAPAVETTEAAVVSETTADPEAKADDPKTVRVKVDGQEYDAPQDEIEAYGGVRAYQIAKAQENRLNKTNQALEETRKFQAQVAEFLMRQQPAQPAKAEPTDDQFISERMDKIRFGSPEESSAAMREVIQRGQQHLDPQAIINAATNRFRNEQAVAEFKMEFSDVLANPLIAKLAITLERERIPSLPKGQVVDWSNFYRTIGNELRPLIGRQSQPASTTDPKTGTTSQPSDKEARKSSIVNLPTAAARAEMPKEEKEPTPEEARKQWIADAKKSRGQA